MGGDIAQAIGLLALRRSCWGSSTFLSMWVHRANDERGKIALTMGLYIVFGAFGFFLTLYGLGSAYREYRNGNSIDDASCWRSRSVRLPRLGWSRRCATGREDRPVRSELEVRHGRLRHHRVDFGAFGVRAVRRVDTDVSQLGTLN